MKVRSIGPIGRVTCEYICRMQSDNRLFSAACLLNHLLSLQYLRHSVAQLNKKIRTEHNATTSEYDFTLTLVVQSLLHTCPSPANFNK